MKVNIIYRGVESVDREQIKRLIESWAKRHLEPRLTRTGVARCEMAAVITKRQKGADPYVIKLRMHIPPKKILVVRGQADQLEAAVDKALERLLREVERHIARVYHQESDKRRARQTRLKELKARNDSLPADRLAGAAAAVDALLPRLKLVAGRELAFLRSQGDLPPNYPTVQDVVDEAVASVIGDWDPGLDSASLFMRLLKEMHKVLDREVRASTVYGEPVSLETPAPKDALDQAERMVGEEFYEFWQPDEMLKIEDIVAVDFAVDTAHDNRDEQETGYILQLLKDLPIMWRRALMLHELEKIPEKDLAKILDLDLSTVTSQISYANHFIRAKMEEAGLEVQAGNLLSDLVNWDQQ